LLTCSYPLALLSCSTRRSSDLLTGCFFRTGQSRTEHHRVSTAGNRLHQVTGAPHGTISNNMHVATTGLIQIVTTSRRNICHGRGDRKSTRLNSSHVSITYAVLC